VSDAAKIFLNTLFARSSNGLLFATSLANDKALAQKLVPRQMVTRDIENICKFMLGYDQPGRATYICVATLRDDVNRRAKANLAELVCLHADLDFKGIAATPDDIERVLAELPHQPSIVVSSGHGLHAYWLLEQALPASPENVTRIEWLLRKLAHVLAGDPQVCECARIMRLPGSHNSKNNEWLEVTIRHNTGELYVLGVFERWLMTAPALLPRVEGSSRPRRVWTPAARAAHWGDKHCIPASVDIEQRLTAMSHHATDGTGLHDTQLSVTAALLRRGYSVDYVVARVLAATQRAVGAEGLNWNWTVTERELRGMCRTWLAKQPVTTCSEEVFNRTTPE